MQIDTDTKAGYDIASGMRGYDQTDPSVWLLMVTALLRYICDCRVGVVYYSEYRPIQARLEHIDETAERMAKELEEHVGIMHWLPHAYDCAIALHRADELTKDKRELAKIIYEFLQILRVNRDNAQDTIRTYLTRVRYWEDQHDSESK